MASNTEQEEPNAINKYLGNSNNILQQGIINYEFIRDYTCSWMCINMAHYDSENMHWNSPLSCLNFVPRDQ